MTTPTDNPSATGVTQERAQSFLESAVRNWQDVAFDLDGLEDVRVELERFRQQAIAQHEGGRGEPVAWMYEKHFANIGLKRIVTTTRDIYAVGKGWTESPLYPPVTAHETASDDPQATLCGTDDRQDALVEAAKPLLRAAHYTRELDTRSPLPDGERRTLKDMVLTSELEALADALSSPRSTQQSEEVARLNALADEQARYANVKKDECLRLRSAINQAAEWFDRYAWGHDAKPGGAEKAQRNRERAAFLRAALNEQPGREE